MGLEGGFSLGVFSVRHPDLTGAGATDTFGQGAWHRGTSLLSNDGLKGKVRLALVCESGQRLALDAQGMDRVTGECVQLGTGPDSVGGRTSEVAENRSPEPEKGNHQRPCRSRGKRTFGERKSWVVGGSIPASWGGPCVLFSAADQLLRLIGTPSPERHPGFTPQCGRCGEMGPARFSGTCVPLPLASLSPGAAFQG